MVTPIKHPDNTLMATQQLLKLTYVQEESEDEEEPLSPIEQPRE
jgi:hypothetical protein